MSDDANNGQGNEGGDGIAELRAAAERGRKAERENVMLRAGVDIDTPLGKMFAKAYEGEMTPDAVKAAALEVGAIKPPEAPPAAPPAPAAEGQQQQPATGIVTPQQHAADLELQRQQQQMQRDLHGGAPSGDTPPETADPFDQALGHFHDARKKGVPEEMARLGTIDMVLDAASRGDKRVLHPGSS